jgi:hypothetical protein
VVLSEPALGKLGSMVTGAPGASRPAAVVRPSSDRIEWRKSSPSPPIRFTVRISMPPGTKLGKTWRRWGGGGLIEPSVAVLRS